MKVQIEKYPQLAALCWSRPGPVELDGGEALALYERNWRFIDQESMTDEERNLIEELVTVHGAGVLNV